MKRLLFTTLSVFLFLAAAPLRAEDFRVLVLFAACSDTDFQFPRSEHENLCTQLGAYFDSQYHGARRFHFEAGPAVTLPQPLRFYARNTVDRRDAQLYELVSSACQLADGTVNYARYDNDGDDVVDGILILLPGPSESDGAGEDWFWPQHASLSDRNVHLTLDGKRILLYGTATEVAADGSFTGIGDFAHEFGHILGLPDFYDSDENGSGGTARGLWGSLSLMDRGNENDCGRTPPNLCAAELWALDTGRGEKLSKAGTYTLEDIGRNGRYYILETGTPGASFLLECRSGEGRDSHIGGSGLLVTQVDRSEGDAGYSDYYRRNLTASERWALNQVNCRPDHPCVRLLEATPAAQDVSEVFFPQEGRTAIGSESDPALRGWDGQTSLWALTDIRKNGDGSVSFTLFEPLTLNMDAVFQDAAIFRWTVDERLLPLEDIRISCDTPDAEPLLFSPAPDARSFLAEGLQPQHDYKVILKVRSSDGSSHSLQTSFNTRPYRARLHPFIYLPAEGRLSDGRFARGTRIPLRVFNAVEAQEVRWLFNDAPVSPDADGRFALTADGALKAEILYPDGSRDIILKEIRLK